MSPLSLCMDVPRDPSNRPLFKFGRLIGRAQMCTWSRFKIFCVSVRNHRKICVSRIVLCFVCVSDPVIQAGAITHCLSTRNGGPNIAVSPNHAVSNGLICRKWRATIRVNCKNIYDAGMLECIHSTRHVNVSNCLFVVECIVVYILGPCNLPFSKKW